MANHQGVILLALARRAIATQLGIQANAVERSADGWLQGEAATFVTLTLHGALLGCIGSLEAYRPLIDDVQANAVAAAFHDPRFPPLTAAEFAAVEVEVSVLTALQPLPVANEAEAMASIRPGMDGVVLEYGSHRGTFLPQVWEQLPDPAQFMANLKQKAGLPSNFWHPDVRLLIYQVNKYRQTEEGA